jgi:hypothetical protein
MTAAGDDRGSAGAQEPDRPDGDGDAGPDPDDPQAGPGAQ